MSRPRRRRFRWGPKHRHWLAFVALLALGTPASVVSQAAGDPPRALTYRTVDGRALQAYVFSPRGSPGEKANAVLLFHGGGWSGGSPEWTFETARRFADAGLASIAIEYRLSDNAVTPIDALDDVCAAFAWARTQSDQLGITDRLVGHGVSAGGHLVAATVTVGCPQDHVGQRTGPDALLLWSPALDLAGDGWFRGLLQRQAPVSAYSPVEHVSGSTPPTSIVIGDKDTLTPLSGSRRFCDRLLALGVVCELNVYPGVGHLLTRNLRNQESDFDPDPEARADGIAKHMKFLSTLGLLPRQDIDPPGAAPTIQATNAFYYYADVDRAWRFYTEVLGFETVTDYGFAKILRVAPASYLTLVDAERGMHTADEPKSVTLAIVTEQVAEWYQYLKDQEVPMRADLTLTEGRPHDGFVAIDPEGYFLEFERFNPHAENQALMPLLQAIEPLGGVSGGRPSDLGVQATVLWLYYKDLAPNQRFYERVLGVDLLVDQGWAKVYQASATGFIGLVDGSRGLHQATEEKGVTVSFFTDDVEAWFAHAQEFGVELRTPELTSESGRVRVFVGYDAEGYFLEWDTFLPIDANTRLLDALKGSTP